MIFRLLSTWPSQSVNSPITRLHSPISALERYPYRLVSIGYELQDDFHGDVRQADARELALESGDDVHFGFDQISVYAEQRLR